MVKGDKDGDELRYDSTGVLIFEVKYSKGIRNGIEKEYFGNGQLKRSAKYKDNKLNVNARKTNLAFVVSLISFHALYTFCSGIFFF